MPQDPTDDKSTLLQVMAWCHQATSHYLSQCCPSYMLPYGVTSPQLINWYVTWFQQPGLAFKAEAVRDMTMLPKQITSKIRLHKKSTYNSKSLHDKMTIVNQHTEKKITYQHTFNSSCCQVREFSTTTISRSSLCLHILSECRKVNDSCPCLLDLCNWLIENYEAIIFA